MEQQQTYNNNNNRLHLVFVYGSLKSNYWNNSIISCDEDNIFVSEAVTKDSSYHMNSLGAFPGVHRGGSYAIKGELYLVNDRTMTRLDMLEGNGHFYTREQIDIEGYDEPAWIYLLPSLDNPNKVYYNRHIVNDDRSEHILMIENSIQEWNR
jgi:gamma-glutamylcyclotransferase (GGCT)/AIG2-like uncharacterized protein YtfP